MTNSDIVGREGILWGAYLRLMVEDAAGGQKPLSGCSDSTVWRPGFAFCVARQADSCCVDLCGGVGAISSFTFTCIYEDGLNGRLSWNMA